MDSIPVNYAKGIEDRTLLTRAQAAQFLRQYGLPIAAATLAKKAVVGSGPPFRIGNGRALYETADLIERAEAQLGPKLRSTAER